MSSIELAIIDAQPNQSAEISDLALRSKAHWGYDDAFIAACRDELTYSSEYISSTQTIVRLAIDSLGKSIDKKPLGFYALELESNQTSKTVILEALFIEPTEIGQGLGRVLFEDAVQQAKSIGASFVELHSDPFAESFYLAMGCMRVGEHASGSIEGRVLPVMRYTISA